jgi:hypothetical protein
LKKFILILRKEEMTGVCWVKIGRRCMKTLRARGSDATSEGITK